MTYTAGGVFGGLRVVIRSMWRSALSILATAAVLVAATAHAEAEQGPPPPAQLTLQEIYQRAKQWHDAIKGLRIDYTWTEREVTHIPLPFIKTNGTWHKSFVLDSKGDRRRRHDSGIAASEKGPGSPEVEYILDGDRSAALSFAKIPGKIKLVTIAHQKMPAVDDDGYCLMVLNIPVTDAALATYDQLYVWYPHALRNPSLKGLEFRVLPRQEKVDGIWCHVVELPGFQKFWVDTRLGCVCRKRELLNGNRAHPQVRERGVASDFQQVSSGAWVPRSYCREEFVPTNSPPEIRGKINFSTTIHVETIEINSVSDDDFKLAIPAGTLVYDSPHNRLFRVPSDTDEAIRDLAHEAQHMMQSPFAVWRRVLIVAVSAAIVLLAYVFVRRKARRSRAA